MQSSARYQETIARKRFEETITISSEIHSRVSLRSVPVVFSPADRGSITRRFVRRITENPNTPFPAARCTLTPNSSLVPDPRAHVCRHGGANAARKSSNLRRIAGSCLRPAAEGPTPSPLRQRERRLFPTRRRSCYLCISLEFTYTRLQAGLIFLISEQPRNKMYS